MNIGGKLKMRLLNRLKENKFLLITGIISIIIHWRWVFKYAIFTRGDAVFAFDETLSEFTKFLIWNPLNLGGMGFTPSIFYVHEVTEILSNLGVNVILIQKIIWGAPITILPVISMYFLSRRLLKSDFFASISSLIFSLNVYFLMLQSGHVTVSVAYSLVPFLLLFQYKYLEEHKNHYLLISFLILMIIGTFDFRIAYLSFFILLINLILKILLNKSPRKLVQSINSLIIPFILLFMANLYWIINFFSHSSEFVFLQRGLFGTSNFFYGLLLFHPFWWADSGKISFVARQIPPVYFVYPLLAFIGLLLLKKDKWLVTYYCLSLIGIFLIKQSQPPFTWVYQFLFDNFPGFNAFRESSKFFLFVALGFSILIGATLKRICELVNKRRILRYIFYIFLSLFIFMILIETKTMIYPAPNTNTLFIEKKVPSEYYSLKNHLLGDESEFFRTLWVPNFGRFGFYSTTRPYIMIVNLIQTKFNNFVYYKNHGDNWPYSDQIIYLLKQDYSNFLLDTMSVKYLVIPSDPENEIYSYYGDKDFFENETERLDYLKKTDWNLFNISVYENKEYYEHVYLSKEDYLVEGIGDLNRLLADYKDGQIITFIFESDLSDRFIPFFSGYLKNGESMDYHDNKSLLHPKLKFNFINPTKYNIDIEVASDPFLLVFSEAYHPEWKLYPNRYKEYTNWIEGFSSKNYLPENYHIKSNGWSNSWAINPKEMCSTTPCNFSVTLYFKPQSYFYLGGIMSMITLISCISYLIYDWRKRRWEKRRK